MFRFASCRLVLPVLLATLSAAGGMAAQRPVVSSMKNVRAVMESRGYFITPAYESAGRIIPGDEAPSQAFEIVRPADSRVTIGRLFTSCSCVRLESPKSTFEHGEPAVLTLRNVKPTPPDGQIYAIYVQLTSPVRTTLRYDTFVQSDRFIVSAPVEVATVEPVESGGAGRVALPEDPEAVPDLTDQEAVATAGVTEAPLQAADPEASRPE